jgi:hypothetical protein
MRLAGMPFFRLYHFLAISLIAFNAAAYTVTEPKATWPCGFITIEPHLGPAGGVLTDGRITWDQVAEDAMAIWNSRLYSVRFQSRLVNGGCADLDSRNSICWRSPVQEPELQDAVAITWRWRNRFTSEVVEADILVNSFELWDSYRGPRCDIFNCVPEYDLRRVLLHEMGHVLGLSHEDDVPALMSTHVSNLDTLTADDIAGGHFLYPADATKPGVIINSPTNNARFTTAPLNVRGTASDNCLVTHLIYQLNANPSQSFTGTAGRNISWSIPVQPQPGTNTVRVWSVDTSTNQSLPAQRKFFYSVRSPLTVTISGAGSATPYVSGAQLEIGRGYEITAVPAASNLFVAWRDANGGLLSSKAKLVFLMQQNLELRAEFMTNPFSSLAGSYNGLFYQTNGVTADSSGFLRLTLGGLGSYSALMLSAGKTNKFTGKFDAISGQSHISLLRGKTPLTLDLQLDVTGASDFISGVVRGAAWQAELFAPKFGFSAATPATDFAGRYTFSLFPDSDAEPFGFGYGAGVVSLTGGLALSGKLPDGQKFSHGASLSASGLWPLYAHPYSGKGVIIDWIAFRSPPAVDDSFGTWRRPPIAGSRYYAAGFTNTLIVAGSPYSYVPGTRSLNATNAMVILSGGNLAAPITNAVVLNTNGQFLNASTNFMKLYVSTASGVYTGAVRAAGRTVRIDGVLLQDRNAGRGYFFGTNRAGRVNIEPLP